MKQIFLSVLMMSFLAGCSAYGDKTLYEVKTTDGEQLYATSKPELNKNGNYQFYDVNEQKYLIKQHDIIYIEPIHVKR